MLSDEELIMRLREGLSPLHPKADLVLELRRHASPSPSQSRWRWMPRRYPRRLGAGLALAAGPLVAVIVGLAALVLVGHHAHAPSPTDARARDLKSLERDFPFLRRPQTQPISARQCLGRRSRRRSPARAASPCRRRWYPLLD